MHNLGIAWNINLSSGWGLLGLNIAIELQRREIARPVFLGGDAGSNGPFLDVFLADCARTTGTGTRQELDYPVLHALSGDLMRPPGGRPWEGKPNFGLAFIEFGITSFGRKNADRYRHIVAGSTWNQEMLAGNGVENVSAWFQGVDLGRFHPAPVTKLFPGRFVIFSGGALQIRKGQDLVVGAFRRLVDRHPDALLVTAWSSSIQPLFINGLPRFGGVKYPPPVGEDKKPNIEAWLIAEGIPKANVIALPSVNNSAMPEILRQADVAVFPNRAEGGTNLVAMEALACGIPCILSDNTGHRDLLAKVPAYRLTYRPFVPPPSFKRIRIATQSDDSIRTDGWGESDIDEIVDRLEEVYTDREKAKRIGAEAATAMTDWAWPKQFRRLFAALDASR